MRILELIQPCDFTPDQGVPTGEPNVFLCRGCGHTVRDLSAMTEAEALAFLDRRRPDECVMFLRDASKQVQFTDGRGSLIGRIARDAKPMVVMASLALAACGDGSNPSPSATGSVTSALTTTPAEVAPATAEPAPSASGDCPPPSGSGAPSVASADPTTSPAGSASAPKPVKHLTPAAKPTSTNSWDRMVGR